MPAENRRALTDLRAHAHIQTHAQTQVYTCIHAQSGMHAILSLTERYTRKGIHASTHTEARMHAHISPITLFYKPTHGEVYRNEAHFQLEKFVFKENQEHPIKEN